MNINNYISVSFQHRVGEKEHSMLYYAETKCTVDTPEGEFVGVAKCSVGDNFSKKQGRKVALKRALEVSNLNKSDRTLVWKTLQAKNVKIK